MAAFAHPHLALIFGIESWRGPPALVMEYLDGGTLADRLRRGPLAPAEVMSWPTSWPVRLRSIHDAGLLHRDVKPSNIAFTLAGQPKLLDFGLAQMLVDAGAGARPAGARAGRGPWAAGADLTTVEPGRFRRDACLHGARSPRRAGTRWRRPICGASGSCCSSA